ncbi:MAG TPA: sulfur carrier protein ThiS [Planctomycetota bacterium]|nr:sulfur carrier protein ThiS [Planctomycetota bacterium]
MEPREKPDGPTLRVFVNDEVRLVPVGLTVADLVSALGLQPAQVAVERNKVIVRRADCATTTLGEGDRLEIVTFFGGG